jgi:hypothetical protein
MTKVSSPSALDEISTVTSDAPLADPNPSGLGGVNNAVRLFDLSTVGDDSRRFDGHLAEFIAFNRNLNAIEDVLVENYINAKYNLEISTNDLYTGDDPANGDYDYDLIGIGQNSGNNQDLSEGRDGLVLERASGTFSDGNYVWGAHQGGENIPSTDDLPVGVNERFDRIWFVEDQDADDNDIDIRFDLGNLFGAELSTVDETNYVLLRRTGQSGQFTNTGLTSAVANGDQIEFTVAGGSLEGYYTLGTTDEISSPLTIISLNNGGNRNWANANPWNINSSPPEGSNVRIAPNAPVDLNVDATVNDLIIDSLGTLTQENDRELMITGDLTVNGEIISEDTNDGDQQDINMLGDGAILTGNGTIDMGANGEFVFDANTTIAAGSDITFAGTNNDMLRIATGITVTNLGSVTVESVSIWLEAASASWVNSNNSTVSVGDDFFGGNNGILNASAAGNTVIYAGAANDNIYIPSGSQYFNLTIAGSGVKTLSATLEVLGDLNISSVLDLPGTTNLTIGGNWINTGVFNEGTSSVIFDGSSDQSLTAQVTEVFNNLTVQKSGGSVLNLNRDIQINETLSLNNTNINTNGNTVILGFGTGTGETGTLSQTGGSETVIGKFERYISSTSEPAAPIIFPVGTSGSYRPLTLTFNSLASNGSVIAEFVQQNPGNITNAPLDDGGVSVNNTFTEGYWSLTRANFLGSSDFDLSLDGNGFSSFTIDADTRIVSRSSSSADWQLNGVHAAAVGNVANRTGMSQLSGEYALADDDPCMFPNTPNIDGVEDVCIGSTETYSLTGAEPLSTYNWVVSGGTINGASSGVNLTSIIVDWDMMNGQVGEVRVVENNSAAPGGCGTGDTIRLTVNVNPIPVIEISGDDMVTEGQSGVIYSVDTRNNYTYDWQVFGGDIAGGMGSNPSTLTGNTTGSITVDWNTGITSGSVVVTPSEGLTCMPSESAASTTLNVSVDDVIVWVGGGGNNNWGNDNNWDLGRDVLPTDNVRIPSGSNFTVILNIDAVVSSLDIGSDVTFIQENDRELTINGDFNHDGTLTSQDTNDGDQQDINMNSSGGVLSGNGTIDMGSGGEFVFTANTTIATGSDITFSGTNNDNLRIDDDIIVTNNGSVSNTNAGIFANNATARWINAADAYLAVGDEIFDGDGILDASSTGNTVEYFGATADDVKIPDASQYYNLIISGSGVKTVNADLELLGSLTISSTLTLSGTNTFAVGGNWTNSGSFNEGTSTVQFNGSTDQTLTGLITETFTNLLVDKGGTTLFLSQNVQVTDSLGISNCIVDVGENVLTLGFGTGALEVGGLGRQAPATIVGKFERFISSTSLPDDGNGRVLFPVGSSTTYNPIEIDFVDLTPGSLIARFVPGNPGTITNPPISDGGVDINNTYLEGYWSLERANALNSTDYDLRLNGNGFNSFTISNNTRILLRTNSGADWQLDGDHVSTPFNSPVVRRDNMTTLSAEYTLAENDNCSFPMTSDITGATNVCVNALDSVYSVILTSGSTYSWEVIGGTIDGGSGAGTEADPSTRSGTNLNSITVDWGSSGQVGQVQVTEDNSPGGCGPGDPVTLAVNINPITPSEIVGSTSVTTDETGVVYSVTPTMGYEYDWNITGGAIDTPADPDNDVTGTISVTWGSTTGPAQVSVIASNVDICTSETFAPEVFLDVTINDVITWVGGGGNNNWGNDNNWDLGRDVVATDNVLIPAGFDVILNVDATVVNLTIEGNSTLTQQNDRELTINGNLTLNGDIISEDTNDGDQQDINMNGSGAILSGLGSIDMGSDGEFVFTANTTIASGTDITFGGTNNDNLRIDDDIIVTNNGSITNTNAGLFGNNATSRWVNAANSVLSVGDEIFGDGNGIFEANASGNTVEFSGATADDLVIPTGNQYFNLIISGSGVKTLSSNLEVQGFLTISSTLTLDNPTTFSVGGDWTNNGVFNEGTSTTVLNGTADQTLNGLITEEFNNLTVLKAGSTLNLGQNVQVNNSLEINNCIINTGNNTLTLGFGTGVSELGTLTRVAPATVVGKFERYIRSTTEPDDGGGFVIFPVGTAADYRPIEISFDNVVSGSVVAEFVETNPGGITSPPLIDGAFDINNTYTEGYWTLTRLNSLSTTSFDLVVEANGFTSFTPSTDTRLLTRLNSTSNWNVSGAHDGTGFVSPRIKRNNVTVLSGEYTIGENDNCTFPTTSAITGTASVCTGTPDEIYTVSLNAGSSYTWEVIGGTIEGGAGTGTELDPSTLSGIDLNSITVDWGTTGIAGQVQVIEDNSAVAGGCGEGDPVTLAINVNPITPSEISGPTAVTIDQVGVVYAVPALTGYEYDWDITGGTITSPADPDNDVTGSITVTWGSVTGAGQISVVASNVDVCVPETTAPAVTLDVNISDVIVWVGGGGNNNWGNDNNWDLVRDVVATDNVRIPSGFDVVLNVDATVINLELGSGSTITQQNDRELTINGNFTIDGDFISEDTNDGDQQDVNMNGSGGVLSGMGSIDMGTDGEFVFTANTTIAAGTDITFGGTNNDNLRVADDIIVTNNGSITNTAAGLFGNNASARWVNASNSVLNVGDEIFDGNGILEANAEGNTVEYSGATADDIKIPTGGQYYNLVISGSGVKTLSSDLEVQADLTISSTLTLDNPTNLTVGGNWTNTGVFNEGTSTVTFAGTSDQSFSAPSTELFNNLTINKTAGTLNAQVDIQVSQQLTLDAGPIDMGSNALILGTSTTGGDEGTLSHTAPARIIGTFSRFINSNNNGTPLEFPVGTASDLNEATVSFNDTPTGILNILFNEFNPGSSGLSLDDNGTTIFNQYPEGFWSVTAQGGLGSSNYDVDLQTDGFNSFEVTNARVITRPNSSSDWQANGTHVDASGNIAQRDAITILSAEFGLGDITNCTPANTSAVMGDLEVCINETSVTYSAVGGLSGSTYNWSVTGGTIVGGVSSGVGLTSIDVDWGATGGIGEVTVTENNNFDPVFGCGEGAPISLEVNINPLPTGAISGLTNVTTNQTGVTYSVTQNTGYQYDWNVTGATINSPTDPDNDNTGTISVTWGGTTGTQQVSVIASDTVNCPFDPMMGIETTAPEVTLEVSVNDVIVWVGGGGNDNWANENNWDLGRDVVATDNVRIPSGFDVILNVDATVVDLELGSGSTITQQNDRELTINGDLTINGTIISEDTNDGDQQDINMNGPGATLTGTGTIDMGADGEFVFTANTTIAVEADITFAGSNNDLLRIDDAIIVTNNGSITISESELFANNATARWINATNSTLSAGDEIFNGANGVLEAGAEGNTVIYNGGTADDIEVPENGEYWNLTIAGASTKTMEGNITVKGDLTITGELDSDDLELTLEGDWINSTGLFNEGTSSTVIFGGTNNQSITNPSGEVFVNLTTSKSAGAISLNDDIQITNTLNMLEGNINTGAFSIFHGTDVNNAGTLTHTAGSIIGNLVRFVEPDAGISSYLFPLGTTTDYRPNSITFTNVTVGGAILSAFLEVNPGNQGLPLVSPDAGVEIRNTFVEGYWLTNVVSAPSFTSYDVALVGNGFSSFTISELTARVVSRANSGSNWLANGTHGAVTGNTITRTGLTTFPLDFAFGAETDCTVPNTSAISKTNGIRECTNSALGNVNYAVTNTPGSTYNWVVNGGTIVDGQGENEIEVLWGSTGGTYTITVTENNSGVTGGCGIGSPVTTDITLNPIPTSGIVGRSNVADGTLGEDYSLTATSDYEYTYSLDGLSGSSIVGAAMDGTLINTTGLFSLDIFGDGSEVINVLAEDQLCMQQADPVTLDLTIFPIILSDPTSPNDNWTNPATWIGGVVPQSTNSIQIVAGHSVNQNGSFGITNVIIEGTGEIRAAANNELTVNGDFINNGTFTSLDVSGEEPVISFNGVGATLDGTGTFNTGTTGELWFNASTAIAESADLTITGANNDMVRINNDILVTNNGSITIVEGIFGGNAGSTWVNASGGTLTVGDALLGTGTLVASQSGNTVIYNSTGNQNIKSPSGAEYSNLIVEGGGTKEVPAGGLVVNDSLTINDAITTLDANNNTIEVGGNWRNEGGTFTEGNGTVIFNGSGGQIITNTTGETFDNFVLNNATGLVLNGDVDITGTLTFTQGTIDASINGNTLTLGENATTPGTLAHTSGYVVGNFRRWISTAQVSTDIFFPIGSTLAYLPDTLNFGTITTGGTITGVFNAVDPESNNLNNISGEVMGNNPTVAFSDGYWTISVADGFNGDDYSIDVVANDFDDFAIEAETRLISRSNGGATDGWGINGMAATTLAGTHVAAIPSSNSIKRSSISTSDINFPIDFGVADVEGCPTVATDAISGDIEVCTNDVGDIYAVTSNTVLGSVAQSFDWFVFGGEIVGGSMPANDDDASELNTGNSITVDWSANGGVRRVGVVERLACPLGDELGDTVDYFINVNPIPAGPISGNFGVAENSQDQSYVTINRTNYDLSWAVLDPTDFMVNPAVGSIDGPNTNSTVTIDWATGVPNPTDPQGLIRLQSTYTGGLGCGNPADVDSLATIFSNFVATTSGDVTDPNTWNCGCIPPNNADITINNGVILTLTNSTVAYRNVTINNGGTLNNNGFDLTINGNIVLNGLHTGSGTTDWRGIGASISGNGTKDNGVLQISQGDKLILSGSNLVFSTTNSELFIASGLELDVDNSTVRFDGAIRGGATGEIVSNDNATVNFNTSSVFATGGRIIANSPGNTVNYQFNGDQNVVAPSGTPGGYRSLSLSGSGNKTLGDDTRVNGNLVIGGTANLVAGSNTVTISGNWTNNSSFDPGTSTVVFNGAGSQAITGTAAAFTDNTTDFYNLTINNTGAGVTVSGTDIIDVDNELNLTDGNIIVANTAALVLDESTTINGDFGSSVPPSYVRGPLTINTTTTNPSTFDLLFPVGDDQGLARIDFEGIDQIVPESYTVNYIRLDVNSLPVSDPLNTTYGTTTADLAEDGLATRGYWEFTRTNGSGTFNQATMRMYYTAIDAIEDFENLTIAKADDTTSMDSWTNLLPFEPGMGGGADVDEFGGSGNIAGNIAALITSFSVGALANNGEGNNPLPVELVDFTGEKIENVIRLKWSTASEINNEKFILEHTTDLNEPFSVLGEEPGNGNSTEIIEYSFTHNSPVGGVNYYRLKQVDFDGTESISRVISVLFNLDRRAVEFTVYPNPVMDDYFNLELSGLQPEQEVPFGVVDLQGNYVIGDTFLSGTNGVVIEKIDGMNSVKSGVYFVVVVIDGGKPIFKRIIVE